MKEHLDAAERQKLAENEAEPTYRMTFAEDLTVYRAKLDHSSERPNTKACRKSRAQTGSQVPARCRIDQSPQYHIKDCGEFVAAIPR